MAQGSVHHLPNLEGDESFGGFGLDVLNKLTVPDWVAFFKAGRRVTFLHDDFILKAGQVNESIYFLADGETRVEISNDDKLIELARLSTGSLFGEMSYLEKSIVSANVIAEGKAEVICVDKNAMTTLFEEIPGLSERFYHSLAVTLSRRLRATNRMVD